MLAAGPVKCAHAALLAAVLLRSVQNASSVATKLLTNRTARGAIQRPWPLIVAVLCTGGGREYATTTYLKTKLSGPGFKLIEPDCSKVFTRVAGERAEGQSAKGRITWGRRLATYRDVLHDLPDDQIVIYMDSHDYLFWGSAQEIAQRFRAQNVSVLGACTFSQWPPQNECPAYKNVEARYKPLTQCMNPSGGGFMGYAAGLRDLYAREPAFDGDSDDQCWLHEILNQKMYGPQGALGSEQFPVEHQATWALDVTMSVFSELCVADAYSGGTAARLEVDGYLRGPKAGPELERYPSLSHLTRSGLGRDLKLTSRGQLSDFYKEFTKDHIKVNWVQAPPNSFAEKVELRGRGPMTVGADDVKQWPNLAQWLGKTLPPTPAPPMEMVNAPPLPLENRAKYMTGGAAFFGEPDLAAASANVVAPTSNSLATATCEGKADPLRCKGISDSMCGASAVSTACPVLCDSCPGASFPPPPFPAPAPAPANGDMAVVDKVCMAALHDAIKRVEEEEQKVAELKKQLEAIRLLMNGRS